MKIQALLLPCIVLFGFVVARPSEYATLEELIDAANDELSALRTEEHILRRRERALKDDIREADESLRGITYSASHSLTATNAQVLGRLLDEARLQHFFGGNSIYRPG